MPWLLGRVPFWPRHAHYSRRSRPGRMMLRPNPRATCLRGAVQPYQKRTYLPSAVPAVFIPPLVFTGLFLSLWLYKCCMMIVFQNKIIYMPGVPPYARREKIADYVHACRPVVWLEERIRTRDAKGIALCVGEIPHQNEPGPQRHVIILYFQG